jgi:UDP-3-O-[3-hydroxymyristoyl] glucosamine N-acyltransferase
VLGHLDVGAGATVGAMSMVTGDIEAGAKRSGIPAIEHRDWLRVATLLKELPAMAKRLAELEKKMGGG